jgi:hypothetical protein
MEAFKRFAESWKAPEAPPNNEMKLTRSALALASAALAAYLGVG